jgi:hypothetical protein
VSPEDSDDFDEEGDDHVGLPPLDPNLDWVWVEKEVARQCILKHCPERMHQDRAERWVLVTVHAFLCSLWCCDDLDLLALLTKVEGTTELRSAVCTAERVQAGSLTIIQMIQEWE